MNAKSFSAVLLGAAVFLCGSLLFSQSLEIQPTRTDDTYRAGEPVAYTLTARDVHGNIIRNWDETGSTVTIALRNSTANTDDIEPSPERPNYTYAAFFVEDNELAAAANPDEWLLPNGLFQNGTVTLVFIDTKAESDVYFEVDPKVAPLNQVSPKMTFLADELANYTVKLVSAVPSQNKVYQLRKYEIIVTPEDEFGNEITDLTRTRFTARWPGEFNNDLPGLSDVFSGVVELQGETNYFIASNIIRQLPDAQNQLQQITAFSDTNFEIRGSTPVYEVIPHAPYPFALQLPPDHSVYNIARTTSTIPVRFEWETPAPRDPYFDIQISETTGERGSDVVTYKVVFIDSASLTNAQRLDSDNLGSAGSLSIRESNLVNLAQQIDPPWGSANLVWFVEATDGLYITKSSPPGSDPQQNRGWHIFINGIVDPVDPLPGMPEAFTLAQNYPNPFNPSTAIDFSVERAGDVSVKVYTPLGEEVATLVDEYLTAGNYTTSFSGESLPSGVYLYRLQAGEQVLTRQMVLMK